MNNKRLNDIVSRRNFICTMLKGGAAVMAAGTIGYSCKTKEYIITGDNEGLREMMSACAKYQEITTAYNGTNKPERLYFNGQEIEFVPDGYWYGNRVSGFIEFLADPTSDGDSITSAQRTFIQNYNATTGTPQGKTLLAGPGTKEDISDTVSQQLDSWGFKRKA